MTRSPFASIALSLISGLFLASAGCSGAVTTASSDGGSGVGGSSGASGGTGGTTTTPTCTPSEELCDGIDNNCDGNIDEDCGCSPAGKTQSCYTGDPATQDKGSCKSGIRTCDEHGMWSACAGDVLPAEEKCNDLDDDCDGEIDDMGLSSCGVGACMVTVPVCAGGVLSQCTPGTPAVEICDGIDNNCNQLVDEAYPDAGKACDTGKPGICSAGITKCVTLNGITVPNCVPNLLPGTEQCDGLDNDCDGQVDDNIVGTGAACTTGLNGSCNAGTVSCQGGVIDCFPNNPPTPEICDGLDNDCSGVADDFPGAGMPCDTGLLGACKAGVNGCHNGVFGCIQTTQAQATDVCGDNIDNDCDGTVDPGCLYTFTGVQTNVPIADLVGWTQCYMDTYAGSGTALTTIQAQCNKAKLLLGCRPTGGTSLQVAAWAPRTDVLFDTGTGNVTHDANGVGWYYNGSWSWGFAPQGDAIQRNSCDTVASSIGGAGADPDKRLCWHTGGGAINGGWRCGSSDSLNGSGAFQRLVFHAD